MALPIEGILETSLYVDDLDAAERFYGGLLGLAKVGRVADRHVFFRCGAGMLLVFNAAETIIPPAAGALPVPTHGATGAGHACFRVARQNLDAIAERLEAAGIAIDSKVTWPSGARSIYFRDPAGNSLECAEPALWQLE